MSLEQEDWEADPIAWSMLIGVLVIVDQLLVVAMRYGSRVNAHVVSVGLLLLTIHAALGNRTRERWPQTGRRSR